jgi:hypothetical protein
LGEVPDELLFELPTSVGVLVSESAADYGPICNQPPIVALVSPLSESPRRALVVTPLLSVDDACTSSDVTCIESVSQTDVLVGEVVGAAFVDSQRDLVTLVWTTSGGFPMRATATRISLDEVVTVAETIEVSESGELAPLDESSLAGLQIREAVLRPGEWQTGIVHAGVYQVDDHEFQVSAQFGSALSIVERPGGQAVDIQGHEGLWVPDGGGFLLYSPRDGVIVTVEGLGSPAAAAEVAASIELRARG